LVVLVVIDDPDRRIKHFGGSVAGPAARDIMEGALQYLGVAPDQPDAPKPVARAD
jgi:cell division protein FtsI/penicillin-binding protein 2